MGRHRNNGGPKKDKEPIIKAQPKEKKPNYGLTFTKFTGDKKRQERYLNALEQGATLGAAAKSAGISSLMAREYRKVNKEFDALCIQARDDGIDKRSEQIEDSLFKVAMRGNLAACLAWLYNRRADKWRDMRSFQIKGLEDVFKFLPPELVGRLRPILAAFASA